MSKAPTPASVKTLTEMHHRTSHLCTSIGLHALSENINSHIPGMQPGSRILCVCTSYTPQHLRFQQGFKPPVPNMTCPSCVCWHTPSEPRTREDGQGQSQLCVAGCAGASLRQHSWMSLIPNTRPSKYTEWLCNKLMQAGWDYEIRFWTMLEQPYSSGLV